MSRRCRSFNRQFLPKGVWQPLCWPCWHAQQPGRNSPNPARAFSRRSAPTCLGRRSPCAIPTDTRAGGHL